MGKTYVVSKIWPAGQNQSDRLLNPARWMNFKSEKNAQTLHVGDDLSNYISLYMNIF